MSGIKSKYPPLKFDSQHMQHIESKSCPDSQKICCFIMNILMSLNLRGNGKLLESFFKNPWLLIAPECTLIFTENQICCELARPSTSCQHSGPRPCLKTQTAGLCRLCFVSAGESGGRGGGRDLFTWRYTGYGRSQGVVTHSFFKRNKGHV